MVGPEGRGAAGRAEPASRRTSWCPTSTGWTSPTPPPTSWSAAPAPTPSPRSRPSVCRRCSCRCRIGNGEQALNARPVVDAGGGAAGPGRRADRRSGSARPCPRWPPTRPGWPRCRPRRTGLIPRDADEQLARMILAAGGGPMRVPVPEVLLPADAARPGALRRHRRGRPVRHRPDHARPRHHGQRQRRQGLPRRSRRCARSAPRCHVGHAAEQVRDADTLVVSTAVREDNPEVVEAAAPGLRMLPRSAALESVMQGRTVVAVAGTHGKTTTTSLLTVALQHCGADPSFAIGGELNESGLQRPRRQRRDLRGRGRRERRRLPGLLAVRRRW